jgi:hypothetical protein
VKASHAQPGVRKKVITLPLLGKRNGVVLGWSRRLLLRLGAWGRLSLGRRHGGNLIRERRIDLDRLARSSGDGRKDDRQNDERGTQDRGRAGEEVGRTARRHEAGRASADAKSAAFRTLHQDDADQRCGNERLNDQKEFEHDSLFRKYGGHLAVDGRRFNGWAKSLGRCGARGGLGLELFGGQADDDSVSSCRHARTRNADQRARLQLDRD